MSATPQKVNSPTSPVRDTDSHDASVAFLLQIGSVQKLPVSRAPRTVTPTSTIHSHAAQLTKSRMLLVGTRSAKP